MRRLVSFLLALLILFPFVSSHSMTADALGEVWVKEYAKDKFGDLTDQYYLINKTPFKGTYNTETLSDGALGAQLIFQRDGGTLLAYILLFPDQTNQLKNGKDTRQNYTIAVKRTDGTQFETTGFLKSGGDRIEIESTVPLARALSAGSGEVAVYLEESGMAINNYLFRGGCGNFGELYEQEIVLPYYEERYQEAEQLLQDGDYDKAAEIFEELADYRDSAEKLKEAVYQKAVQLLQSGKYYRAAEIFEELADYRDSAEKLEEVEKLIIVAEAEAAHEAFLQQYAVGKTVTFGSYEQDNNPNNGQEPIEWIVLDAQGESRLLISKYALDAHAYNSTYTDITWEKCTLRDWLNNSFLNEAFSANEKKAILTTSVDNSKSQGYSRYRANGGNNTEDQIFLLSYTEAWKYFASDSSRTCKPTAYAKAQGAYVNDSNGNCWWWLRSPGNGQDFAAFVNTSGSGRYNGVNLSNSAVRPAFWINLESDIF